MLQAEMPLLAETLVVALIALNSSFIGVILRAGAGGNPLVETNLD